MLKKAICIYSNIMTNELIEKLRAVLSEDLSDERQVVFILSKTRKLIENEGREEHFPLVKRYTDWALHSKIERTSPMRKMLEDLEHTILSETYEPSIALDVANAAEFKEEFINLLSQFNISNRLNDTPYWRVFRKYLIETLIDCPLKPNFGDMTEFCFRRGVGDDVNFEVKFKSHPRVNGIFAFMNC